MNLKSTLLALAASASCAAAQSGSGPYPANYATDPGLPGHTLYYPTDVPDGVTLPVLVWGNGACAADGLAFVNFLNEVSSHGIFVIASGEPGGSGQTNSDMMVNAIDWVTSDDTQSSYGYLEPSRIAVAGMSCGGLEAYDLAGDDRVSVLGIFNSGFISSEDAQRVAPTIEKPIFYFLGGPEDIAYENGERDYTLLPEGTPSWKGNFPVGHGGTYGDPDGGAFGVAGGNFFRWALRGDSEAAEWFTGDAAASEGWEVESKSLDDISVEPL